MIVASLLLLAGSVAQPAQAQPVVDPLAEAVAGPVESLVDDAAEYARSYDVPASEAFRRLRAQEESVPAIDRLKALYRDRLAGIYVEHRPTYRFVMLLTGTEQVAADAIETSTLPVPVVFRTGALATHDQLVAAIERHQAEIRAALRHPPGLGVDPRSGALVVVVQPEDIDAEGNDALAARIGKIAGVPVEITTSGAIDRDLSAQGGSRVAGNDPADGRRYACTTGFVVTDGTRLGVTTAAHCPDELTYSDRDGSRLPLTMIGAWGARYQDVQIHVAPAPPASLFYADTAKVQSRPVTSWRNRASTRVGDFVCHRGERTGYSCAEIAFVDYALPGDLCAGPCDPSWVAVRGPHCRSGDSGGPVFLGTVAFGIVKGGSYAGGACHLYYYMSTDYLPPGWTVSIDPGAGSVGHDRAATLGR